MGYDIELHINIALSETPGIFILHKGIARQSGCDERVNQDEIARLDFGMIVAIFGFCNA
jgi:hypothetical protein